LALSAGSSIGYDQIPIWRDPCAANLATTTHHVVDQVCAATATAGGGCGIGEVCVPQVPEPWTLGAFQKTDQAVGACPQAWAAFLEQDGGTATAQAMATQWNDFNACSSCNCNPDMDAGCENPNLALYTDPSCTSVAMSLGPNTCTSVNVDVQSARYSATAVQGSGCSIVQPTQPTGIESPMPGAGYLVCHGQ
jgi:hypothetical protein